MKARKTRKRPIPFTIRRFQLPGGKILETGESHPAASSPNGARFFEVDCTIRTKGFCLLQIHGQAGVVYYGGSGQDTGVRLDLSIDDEPVATDTAFNFPTYGTRFSEGIDGYFAHASYTRVIGGPKPDGFTLSAKAILLGHGTRLSARLTYSLLQLDAVERKRK